MMELPPLPELPWSVIVGELAIKLRLAEERIAQLEHELQDKED